MKTATAILAALALLLALGSCTLFTEGDALIDTPTDAQLESFSKVFMSSYWAERGGAPSGDVARAVTPFQPRSVDTGAARATVPVDRLTESVLFSDLQPKTFPNYPEPGQTTSFTATKVNTAPDVYRIVTTTGYPASDLRASYVEEYYVRDDATVGEWTIGDPIVKEAAGNTVDQIARVKMELTFHDGTKRTERIVAASTAGGPKFSPAAFDIDGSLDLSKAFVPVALKAGDPLIDDNGANGEVMYSSVVMYLVTPATYPGYWFWTGSVGQTVFGVRYYTEVALDPAGTASDTYTAYTASFEKTFSTITTAGGDFVGSLPGVSVGSSWDSLAESVLRQRVVYGLAGTAPTGDYYKPSGVGAIASRMRTRVVNAAGLRDFILDQMNDEALAISVADSTFFVPDANAEEILAEDTGSSVYLREQQTVPAPGVLPYATTTVLASGYAEPLSTVFFAITEGFVDKSPADPAKAPASNLFPGGVSVAEFGGQDVMGTTVDGSSLSGMATVGTVEAWIWIRNYTDTAGIIHKGVLPTFEDECFSLQGWGNKGQVGIILDKPTGANSFDSLLSKVNLKKNTWYHIVATWSTTGSTRFIRLYINGKLDNSATPSVSAYRTNDSGIVIGSQLPVTYSAQYGYFGFDGKIAGANVYAEAKDLAWIQKQYNDAKGLTGYW